MLTLSIVATHADAVVPDVAMSPAVKLALDMLIVCVVPV